MTLFLDSASPAEIEDALARGIVKGVTTNPTLVSREHRGDYFEFVASLVSLVRARPIPISVEVVTADPSEMVAQARKLHEYLGYSELAVKIPIGWDELKAIQTLSKVGIRVNVTAIMTQEQALMAIEAGATYVSIFWNRIKDGGGLPGQVVCDVRSLLARKNGHRIIVGSIRHVKDVTEALACGADIVTVPQGILKEMCLHPKTDEVVQQFMRDYASWTS